MGKQVFTELYAADAHTDVIFKAFSSTHKAAPLKQLTSAKRSAFSRIIALKWSEMHKMVKMPVLASAYINTVSDVLM